MKYGPSEKSVMHTHGQNVSIMVSDLDVRMHLPDGTHVDHKSEMHGRVAENEEHLSENLSDEPFEAVLVELKD